MKKLMYLLIIVINLLLNINLSAQESMLIEMFFIIRVISHSNFWRILLLFIISL